MKRHLLSLLIALVLVLPSCSNNDAPSNPPNNYERCMQLAKLIDHIPTAKQLIKNQGRSSNTIRPRLYSVDDEWSDVPPSESYDTQNLAGDPYSGELQNIDTQLENCRLFKQLITDSCLSENEWYYTKYNSVNQANWFYTTYNAEKETATFFWFVDNPVNDVYLFISIEAGYDENEKEIISFSTEFINRNKENAEEHSPIRIKYIEDSCWVAYSDSSFILDSFFYEQGQITYMDLSKDASNPITLMKLGKQNIYYFDDAGEKQFESSTLSIRANTTNGNRIESYACFIDLLDDNAISYGLEIYENLKEIIRYYSDGDRHGELIISPLIFNGITKIQKKDRIDEFHAYPIKLITADNTYIFNEFTIGVGVNQYFFGDYQFDIGFDWHFHFRPNEDCNTSIESCINDFFEDSGLSFRDEGIQSLFEYIINDASNFTEYTMFGKNDLQKITVDEYNEYMNGLKDSFIYRDGMIESWENCTPIEVAHKIYTNDEGE